MEPNASADATGQDAIDAAPPQDSGPAAAPAQADDPAWKQVQTARYSPDEAGAILKFDDYARSHPGQSAVDLEGYTEKALDRIWFERIEQLWKRREELRGKVAEADKDLAAETNDAYKKRVLLPLKDEYGKLIKSVEEELTQNMKYAGPSAPNLLDEAEMERLRTQRDPAAYAGWKARVLAHIRRTHGELPWVGEKIN